MTARKGKRCSVLVLSPRCAPAELVVFCGRDHGADLAAELNGSPRPNVGQQILACAETCPVMVMKPGTDPASVRWPAVGGAAVFNHSALSDDDVRALATAMIDAGIDEVFIAGSARPPRGPWTFRATAP